MREIRDKIRQLSDLYGKQSKLYKQIREVGSGERKLIEQGSLDQLLRVLQEKEGLLKQAGEHEEIIRELQKLLARHFRLDTFSLPQLKLAASVHYQADLSQLADVISELLPVLEALERQEKENESALSKYLEKRQDLHEKRIQVQQVQRAYGKKDP